MFTAKTQDRVVGRAGRLFGLGKVCPALGQDLFPPTPRPGLFFFGQPVLAEGAIGRVVQPTTSTWCPPSGVAFPSPLVIDNQMEQRGFQEAAEPAVSGVGPLKSAADKLQGELLKNLVGRVLVRSDPSK